MKFICNSYRKKIRKIIKIKNQFVDYKILKLILRIKLKFYNVGSKCSKIIADNRNRDNKIFLIWRRNKYNKY